MSSNNRNRNRNSGDGSDSNVKLISTFFGPYLFMNI